MAPRLAQNGDLVCLLFGGQVPFVIRKLHEEQYSLVGECYLQGIMDGETMKMMEDGKSYRRDCRLR